MSREKLQRQPKRVVPPGADFKTAWVKLGDDFLLQGVNCETKERLLLARLYFENAATVFENALAMDPDDPAVSGGLGSCWMHLGMREKAKQMLEKAIEMGDSKARATYSWAVSKKRL